jgi:hydroxymethylpyrimidine kinase / phosphomethylpyrimidine kinase / thiamine-phosphate diphosphorylase
MKILSIAGSDPSSGAGIQSDIKTFSALGAFGFTVITSITSQNTKKFSKIEPISPKMIKSQIESIFSDFSVDAIKIGMVYNSAAIKAVYSKLNGLKIPIILDPVLKSTTGGDLIKKNALSHYKKFLVPLAAIITPNIFEAEKLSGMRIKTKKDLYKSAKNIMKMGAKSVVITGNEFERGKISDYIFKNSKSHFISGKKLPIINHGSGCNFSAALTVEIAKGKDLYSSVKFAKEYAYNSIKKSEKIGKGLSISKTLTKKDSEENSLLNAITKFQNLKNVYSFIPECQTNFVFAKPKAKSIDEVLGVQGRIVKAGKSLVLAGDLKYGGSKHVASAVLELKKKFPKISSAINLKYVLKIIKNSKKKGFVIKSYNRADEPSSIKNKENSSVSWGIKTAIKNSLKSPDIIFHKGDLGKEPMILVFGNNPDEVIRKVAKIL